LAASTQEAEVQAALELVLEAGQVPEPDRVRELVVHQSSIDECCGILFPETIFKCVFQEQESCGGKVSGYADG
jgi:hypothetical protein